MPRKEISTAGITISWAKETTAGTKPTSFSKVPNMRVVPELFNSEPNMLEVSDLAEVNEVPYIEDLPDYGGSAVFEANFTEDFMDEWGDAVSAIDTTGALAIWWEIDVPKISGEKFYFTGNPVALGFPGAGAREVFGGNVYISGLRKKGWM